jgi:hypothetical protein
MAETTKATLTTTVLVRSHKPTEAMVARMREWHRSLADAGIRMHISMDVTHGRDAADCVVEAVPGATLHTYDEQHLLRAFPYLGELIHTMPGERKWSGLESLGDNTTPEEIGEALAGGWRKWAGKRHSLAWGFHAEAISLWWRSVYPDCADGDRPQAIWVLEDDVGYTAELAALVAAYANDGVADLITDEPTQSEPLSAVRCQLNPDLVATEPVVWQGWCWHDTCTDLYNALVPSERRWKTKEHAQRFSARLVDELARQCDAGCSAWSEQFAVSLCISSANFKCVALHPSTLPPDPKRQYNHDAKVDEELFKELCTNPQTCHGVLLHAMKW